MYTFIAGLLAFMAGFGMLAIFLAFLLPIALYIFSSLGLYTMAQIKGLDYPWLAWIPFVKLFIVGELINEKVYFGSFAIPLAQVILPISAVCSGAFATIPYIGWLIGIAFLVYNYVAYYRFYKLYNADSAILFLVLSIIFPFMLSIFPFIIRNRESIEYIY
ncbi:MAG: hypothetical protein RR310_03860 [Eubacterium sp.]